MSVFCPDVIGSPSGSVLQQNIRAIVCNAPKAANQLSVTRQDITITTSPTGVFLEYKDRFHRTAQPVYSITGGSGYTMWG